MQHVEKKRRRSRPWLRWLLLAVLLLALAVTILTLRHTTQPIDYNSLESPDTYGELMVHDAAEVAGLTVTLPGGDTWTLQRQAGAVVMADDPSFPLDEALTDSLLEAASIVSYSAVLADTPDVYHDKLTEFGLDQPTTVSIAYTDGTGVTLRIGSRSDDLDAAYYYMLIDGDDHLYALDVTTAHTFSTERYLLHAVVQPTIHKARIDAVTVETPLHTLQWQLDGDIHDADAADRWLLISPVRYPADGERIAVLRENLANLRLGAYVAEADSEHLTAYGFDTPQMTLTVHQGAGSIGTVDSEGVYNAVDWPESTLTFTVGAAKNDNVDYVLYNGSIYITSHYSLQTLMNMDEQSTLTRYPVLTSLSNLASLTIAQNNAAHTWVTTCQEQQDDTGATVLDDAGQPVLTDAVTLDGQPASYEAFASAYNRVLIATVSGTLPEGWQPGADPHTMYTFATKTGVTHTISLTNYDALHDAVTVDGSTMFYIIKGGLDFNAAE